MDTVVEADAEAVVARVDELGEPDCVCVYSNERAISKERDNKGQLRESGVALVE